MTKEYQQGYSDFQTSIIPRMVAFEEGKKEVAKEVIRIIEENYGDNFLNGIIEYGVIVGYLLAK